MTKKGRITVGRSSVSGRFVKVKYAKQHPRTTEVQQIRKNPKRK